MKWFPQINLHYQEITIKSLFVNTLPIVLSYTEKTSPRLQPPGHWCVAAASLSSESDK